MPEKTVKVSVKLKAPEGIQPEKIEVGDKTLVSGGDPVELTESELEVIKRDFDKDFEITEGSTSSNSSSSGTAGSGSGGTGGGSANPGGNT